MNILLIGNGFDLEHKLPTTYRDFLNFCDAVTYIYTKYITPLFNEPDHLDTLFSQLHLHDDIISKLYASLPYSKLKKPANAKSSDLFSCSEVFRCIRDNLWYLYFKHRLFDLGDNWIDFEKEISYVIQTLDLAKDALEVHSNPANFPGKLQSDLSAIENGLGISWTAICSNTGNILNFASELSRHLSKFIRALEIYLAIFVGNISVPADSLSPDILQLRPSAILSFNYTNTYNRIFEKLLYPSDHYLYPPVEYCYIHGEAVENSNVESCNLVLGIDEYLSDDRKNLDLDFLHFKKYYQRIYKSTDSRYIQWIDDIRSDPDINHTLYIFGHSLDVTDKDVLYQLICNDNVQTKIFYYRKQRHDKSVLGQLIHNLVRIIGQDELIRRTGGSHRTIEFIPQTLRE